MNICQISREFYDDRSGGIGTYVYDLSRTLASWGHDVDIITSIRGKLKCDPKKEKFSLHCLTIGQLPIWGHVKWGKFASDNVKKLIKGKRYDVIHVHFLNSSSYPFFHNSDIPLIATAHVPPLGSIKLGTRFENERLVILQYVRLVEQIFAYKKVNRVIAVSAPVLSELMHLGIPQNKCLHIPNCIDTKKFSIGSARAKTKLRQIYGIRDEIVLLFVGRLVQRKGVQYLIDAMSKLNKCNDDKFKLFIVGDGNYKDSLMKQARHVSNVFFTGLISDEKLKTMYLLSDIFVFPSLCEGLPTVILEAMASGLPVIASDIPEIRSIITKDVGILCKRGNASELSEAIMSLARDRKRCETLRKNALIKARKYDWDIGARKILEVYRDAINGKDVKGGSRWM